MMLVLLEEDTRALLRIIGQITAVQMAAAGMTVTQLQRIAATLTAALPVPVPVPLPGPTPNPFGGWGGVPSVLPVPAPPPPAPPPVPTPTPTPGPSNSGRIYPSADLTFASGGAGALGDAMCSTRNPTSPCGNGYIIGAFNQGDIGRQIFGTDGGIMTITSVAGFTHVGAYFNTMVTAPFRGTCYPPGTWSF